MKGKMIINIEEGAGGPLFAIDADIRDSSMLEIATLVDAVATAFVRDKKDKQMLFALVASGILSIEFDQQIVDFKKPV